MVSNGLFWPRPSPCSNFTGIPGNSPERKPSVLEAGLVLAHIQDLGANGLTRDPVLSAGLDNRQNLAAWAPPGSLPPGGGDCP